MNGTDDTVAEARAAWARIKENARTSWNDWVLIGKALISGRSEAMKAAKINRPYGATYVRIFGAWLREHGLDGIDTQQRYLCILCIENLPAIEEWRATLDEKKRNAWNHPSAVFARWKQSTKAVARSPQRHAVTAADVVRRGRAIYWPQDAMRRAHQAMLDSRSHDLLTLARVALQAAIRSEEDLLSLLPSSDDDRAPRQTKSPPMKAEAELLHA
jgi:hypothetical protein